MGAGGGLISAILGRETDSELRLLGTLPLEDLGESELGETKAAEPEFGLDDEETDSTGDKEGKTALTDDLTDNSAAPII